MKEKAPKMGRKQLRWHPSTSPSVVGYRLYWDTGCDVTYESEFIELGERTQLILPDDVPYLYKAGGEVKVGVTAVSHTGNESDMVKVTVHLNQYVQDGPERFLRPGSEGFEAPLNAPILIDDLHHWVIMGVLPSLSRYPHNYYVDTHHIDEVPY